MFLLLKTCIERYMYNLILMAFNMNTHIGCRFESNSNLFFQCFSFISHIRTGFVILLEYSVAISMIHVCGKSYILPEFFIFCEICPTVNSCPHIDGTVMRYTLPGFEANVAEVIQPRGLQLNKPLLQNTTLIYTPRDEGLNSQCHLPITVTGELMLR